MGRWKRFGVIIFEYLYDHTPRHVHLFEDGKRLIKFNIDSWSIIDGKMTAKARKALEALKEEGVFDEKPKI